MTVKKYPTCIGYCALIFWVLAAPFTATVTSLPLFETLSLTFLVSFLFSAAHLTIRRQWHKLKQPWPLYLIGFIGIYGNQIFYVASFKYAPASHADLINYLWPLLILVMTGFLPNEQRSIKHLLAACLGFAGVYILLCQGDTGFDRQYLPGYILAFIGALVWALYSITARFFNESPVEMIGLYCGFAALVSGILHGTYETTQLPQSKKWTVLLLMGLTTQGLAYFCWDFGVKNGDFKLLSLLSYGNPVLSMLVLILLGMASPTRQLVIAFSLVALGGFIGMMPMNKDD
ncbi:DMT family transporter [Legionella erythra]|uniref:Aromatic amino acid exporter YddG n=1 Tax=Legionella erythra TaxID=448 RepID=A0A0W0TV78_LEGER|nr:DMT family transporter [Legionella erythra]KTC99554.1 Aromatic amino acid exporter YddG [Legionella erythra]